MAKTYTKKYRNFDQPTIPSSNREDFVDCLSIEGLFTEPKSKKLALQLEEKYLAEYAIQSVSDKNLLYYLIYLEVLQITRLQGVLSTYSDTNQAFPPELLEAIHKNLAQIISVKDKLGLIKVKKNESDEPYDVLQKLKKKFEIWKTHNQASRTMICPHCVKPILLKIRTEQWEAQNHPFFEDRILGSRKLIELFQSNKITKEDVAAILKTSPDYVDWLVSKWNMRFQEKKDLGSADSASTQNNSSTDSTTQDNTITEDGLIIGTIIEGALEESSK